MSEARRGPDSVLADLLADLANASLNLDPVSRERLGALEGHRLQISVEGTPFGTRELGLAVSAGRLRFFAHALEQPNVIVRGTPPDLTAWLVAGEGSAGGHISIDGDTTVLAELRSVITAFRPDLAAPLSRLLGAGAAQNALGAAELALASLRSALAGAGHTVREGASRTFVDHPSMETFLDGMDDLRLRVDRLAARVREQEDNRSEP